MIARVPHGLIIGLLLAALWSNPATAVDPKRSLIELHLQSWQTQHGLPHNMVQAIAQTPDGYLWFGTWEGVARFNGFEFTIFDPQNVPELRDRGVRALLVSRDGSLWLGTSKGGVSRLKDDVWTTIGSQDGLSGDGILSLAEDSRGRIWVGTEANGVSIIDAGSIETLGMEDGLNDYAVLDITERQPGEMWLTTRQGVVRIQDNSIDAFNSSDGLPEGNVLSVLANRDGSLLFGTEQGMYRWNGDGFGQDQGWSNMAGQVSVLLSDRDGVMWAGTFAHGLYRLTEDSSDGLRTSNGMPNNRVSALFEDAEGNLWVGTSGGLARLKSAPFSVLTMRNGLSDNYVRSMIQSADGSFWIGTSNGLNHIVGTRTETLTTDDGLNSNSILSLHETDQGELWVGTYGAGINVLKDGAVIGSYSLENGLPSNHVRSLIQSSDGSIWAGTISGLVQFKDRELITILDSDTGLSREYVQALHEDQNGSLWIGMAGGLARLDAGVVREFGVEDGFDGADVFGFHRDPFGNFWIATENGLLRYKDSQLQPIRRIHGLPHEVVFGVTSDRQGSLWMSSNAGIFRAPIEQLVLVAEGEAAVAMIDQYTEDHGLGSRQCNGGSEPSLMQVQGGQLWFATSNGAAVIDPTALASEFSQPAAPNVVIEALLVDGRPVDRSKPIRILPGARHFEFRYAGLSFRSPENIQYRVRLAGFETERSTGFERAAHYTNLDAGTYEFVVWGALSPGRWSSEPARLQLEVVPNFWETRVFLFGALLTLIFIIWGVVRLRISNFRARARELESLVNDRTHDLKQQTDRLERADQEKTDLLERLEQQSLAFARQAREDSLTSLSNRRHFDELLEREFHAAREQSTPLSVAVLDLDHFKQINDQYSHHTGDIVLRTVARILEQHCGAEATPARYGGEEFVILFPGLDVSAAADRCEALRSALEAHDFSELADGLTVTLSAGVSDRLDLPNHEKLVTDADHKLYEAKQRGRNCVVA